MKRKAGAKRWSIKKAQPRAKAHTKHSTLLFKYDGRGRGKIKQHETSAKRNREGWDKYPTGDIYLMGIELDILWIFSKSISFLFSKKFSREIAPFQI